MTQWLRLVFLDALWVLLAISKIRGFGRCSICFTRRSVNFWDAMVLDRLANETWHITIGLKRSNKNDFCTMQSSFHIVFTAKIHVKNINIIYHLNMYWLISIKTITKNGPSMPSSVLPLDFTPAGHLRKPNFGSSFLLQLRFWRRWRFQSPEHPKEHSINLQVHWSCVAASFFFGPALNIRKVSFEWRGQKMPKAIPIGFLMGILTASSPFATIASKNWPFLRFAIMPTSRRIWRSTQQHLNDPKCLL